jgi:hypothetical protein
LSYINIAYIGNSAVGMDERCELQFFRRHCEGFCARKELELAFVLDFRFFWSSKRK